MSKRSRKSNFSFKRKPKSRAGRRRLKEKDPRRNSHKTIQGVISVSPGGFGFVTPEAGGADFFIPIKFINQAMDGDTVLIVKLPPRPIDEKDNSKGPAGKVIEIVQRARQTLVGSLVSGKKVRPLNNRITEDIKIKGSLCGAKRGDWVEINLFPPESKHESFSGTINRKFGKTGTINADLDAIVAEFELEHPYTEEQEKEVSLLNPRKITRRDLTNLFCVSIDPIDAKDYDDAVSINETDNDNEIIVGIHIADVAAWIKPNSVWDREARKRAFTAYLPGRTLPMLPKNLTAKISLSPEGESLAHSVLLTIDKSNGKILKSERCHSKIKLTRRMNFDEVQGYIDSRKIPKNWNKEIAAKMEELISITALMRHYRKRHENFLELEAPEVRVLCNEAENKIIGLSKKIQKEADKLIEDCMLAANSAVAKEMISKHLPALFRTHPEPAPEKLEEFGALMAATFQMSVGNLSSRSACNQFLESLEDNPRKPIIINAFLRSMPRAVYEHEPAIHFGLGKGQYSHFTSPIRRYSDTLVHQQLWALEENQKLRSKIDMEKFGSEISAKEENNDNAYYAANDRLKLRYIDEQLQSGDQINEHEGLVVKINGGGMLIDVQSLGIFGFSPLELLPGDFSFDRNNREIKSWRRKKSFKCGDIIFVHLRGIDYAKGNAILRPIL